MAKFFEWRGDPPQPFPVDGAPYTKENLRQLTTAALRVPYELLRDPLTGEILPGEEQYRGMSCGEVMKIRQAQEAAQGNLEAGKYLEDRLLGKPTQHQENLNLNVSYRDLLKQFRQMDEEEGVVEATEVRRIGPVESETIYTPQDEYEEEAILADPGVGI